MFVPLHDRHQIKQYGHAGECKSQRDITFAAGAFRIVIPHDPTVTESAGMLASFSTIRAANKAAR